MKKRIIILLSFVCMGYNSLLAQTESLFRDIECYNLGDGRYYCHDRDTKKPLEGSSRIIDGYTTQYVEATFKEGVPSGSWKIYKYNKLVEEYTYEDGLLHGFYKEYYSDGAVKAERNYVKGKPEGKFKKYDPKGKVESEVEFKNGLQDGVEIYYDSEGNIRSKTTYAAGKTVGKKIQKFTDYELTANYKNGEYDGDYSEIYFNGNVKIKGKYVAGKKEGTWEYGKKDGKKIRTDVYSKNDKVKETLYYTDGTVEVIRELKNGKKNGWEKKYTYGDGTLKSELYYKDGEVSNSSGTSSK